MFGSANLLCDAMTKITRSIAGARNYVEIAAFKWMAAFAMSLPRIECGNGDAVLQGILPRKHDAQMQRVYAGPIAAHMVNHHAQRNRSDKFLKGNTVSAGMLSIAFGPTPRFHSWVSIAV